MSKVSLRVRQHGAEFGVKAGSFGQNKNYRQNNQKPIAQHRAKTARRALPARVSNEPSGRRRAGSDQGGYSALQQRQGVVLQVGEALLVEGQFGGKFDVLWVSKQRLAEPRRCPAPRSQRQAIGHALGLAPEEGGGYGGDEYGQQHGYYDGLGGFEARHNDNQGGNQRPRPALPTVLFFDQYLSWPLLVAVA